MSVFRILRLFRVLRVMTHIGIIRDATLARNYIVVCFLNITQFTINFVSYHTLIIFITLQTRTIQIVPWLKILWMSVSLISLNFTPHASSKRKSSNTTYTAATKKKVESEIKDGCLFIVWGYFAG